ncbi:MAG: class I SAM-dependent methyltransferase [Vulcanimicrobiaceae bacterium]
MSEALESAQRFAGLARAYDRYRPRYPAAAIAAVLADLRDPVDVADIGAGTGISSRALARAGARVVAIEPNAEMRALAEARGVDVRDGRADATGLDDGCADVVSAFQAFHWFTNRTTLAEFDRLLRPGGRIALVWNEPELRGDPFTAEFRDVEVRFAMPGRLAGANFHDDALVALLHDGGFARVRRLHFANVQRLDRDGLRGRACSTSYAPRTQPAFGDLVAALDALHERFADNSGHVELIYRTDVILGDR